MEETKFALNRENLATMGLYDEFYDLYVKVLTIYSEMYDKLNEKCRGRCIWQREIEDVSKTEIRKLFDEFLNKYTYVFTDKYERIHPNKFALENFKALETKLEKPLNMCIREVSFKKFLENFQEFVARILLQREGYEFPAISYERIFDGVNKRIIVVTEKERSLREFNIQEKLLQEGLLQVFKNLSVLSCNVKKHKLVPGKIAVKLLEKDGYVALPIHCCKTCGKVFIGNETLKIYEKKYGKMLISIRKDESDDDVYLKFSGESELHQAGYNVRRDGLGKKERRLLLVKLWENKIFTDFQIKRDIEKAIRIFDGNPRFSDALDKWRSDLLFISEYVKEKI